MTAAPVGEGSAPNPYHYAIVVGISHYTGLDTLLRPVDDALEFRSWLLDPAGGGLPAENVQTIVTAAEVFDPADPQPKKDEVDDAFFAIDELARSHIGDFFTRRETSRLWVFLSGHGLMPDDGEGALLMANASAERLGENVELRAYADWQVGTGIFQDVVLFADCCRNWEIQARRGLPPATRREPAGRVRDLVGYAVDRNQRAREEISDVVPERLRRGYFTRALLDGLRGAAASSPALTEVTGASLAGYLRSAVAAATAPDSQYVSVRGEWVDDLVLARLPEPPPPPLVTITLPSHLTAQVRIAGAHDRHGLVWSPQNGEWRLGLRPGLYELTSGEGEEGDSVGLLKVGGQGGVASITPRRPSAETSLLTTLRLRGASPGITFAVTDGDGRRVPLDEAADEPALRLAAGIYEITATAGAQDETRLVRLSGGRPVVVDFDVRPGAVAPVPATLGAEPDDLAATRQASEQLAHASGAACGVLIMLRHRSAAESVELLDAAGQPLPLKRTVRTATGSLTLSGRLEPGGYVLRTELAGGAASRRAVWAAAGWQTLVFLDAGGGAAGAPPASVHMTPLAMPWTGELAATHAIETLLDAARVGRAVQVTGRLRDMALATDPVLKLLAAHAIMAPQAVLAGLPGQGAEAGPSQDVVAVLAAQLDDLLPGHPDVRALRAALRVRNGERPRVGLDWPPMLSDSYWRYLLPAAQGFPAVVHPGSALAAIAGSVRPGGPWLTWTTPAERTGPPEADGTGPMREHLAAETLADEAVAAPASVLSQVIEFAHAAAARQGVPFARVIDTTRLTDVANSLELPESVVVAAIETIRAQPTYLGEAVLQVAPDVLHRLNARVLDPATTPIDPDARRPLSTVYMQNSLLVRRSAVSEAALSQAAVERGCRLETDPRFAALAEQERRLGVQTAASDVVAVRLAPDGSDSSDAVDMSPDAWQVMQTYRAFVGGPAALDVSLDHVLVARLGDSAARAGSRGERAAIGARPGAGGHIPIAWLGAAPRARPDSDMPSRRPVVAILDTEIGAHPWLQHAVRRQLTDPEAAASLGPDDDPLAAPWDWYERRDTLSRATFIAGLVRQMCPDAEIAEVPITTVSTAVAESDLALALGRLLVAQHEAVVMGRLEGIVDIAVVPHGWYGESDGDGDSALLALTAALGAVGVAVIAAAGDDASARPRFPGGWAPHPGSALTAESDRVPILNVGSLNPSGTLSDFANTGPSVTCHRSGAVVASTMPIVFDGAEPVAAGRSASVDPDDVAGGFAVWSGTAFAAAVLAGQLAQTLLDTGTLDHSDLASRVAAAWAAITRETGLAPR